MAVLSYPKGKPFLFAVTSADGLSFVFGTQHTVFQMSEFPTYLKAAFDSRPIFAIESLSGASASPHLDKDLKISPTETTLVQLRSRGIPKYLFNSEHLCDFYLTRESGLQSEPYLDLLLELQAVRHKKVLVSLDEPQDNHRIDDAIKKENDTCNINAVARQFPADVVIRRMRVFRGKYLSGDLTTISPCRSASLCEVRTGHWVEKILHHHSKGMFIAVGVAHLGGPKGLLALLKERGLNVEQIESAGQFDRLFK